MKHETKFKETEIGKIPEDWEIGRLKDLIFVKGRIGWKGLKKSEFGDVGNIIINGPNIINGKVNWEDCQRVPEWRFAESKEIEVKEKDILMTKDGTIGKVAYIECLPEPATLASGIFLIRSNSNKLYQKFLYQYFNSKIFKNLVINRVEGSVIPHLYQRDIELLNIILPKIEEQIVIAKILSDLDAKIELNQQMNKTLEEIAKSIFKHWFVDFEFPNEQGKSYKSSGGEMIESELGLIPKGWKVGKLKDLGYIQPGFAFKSSDFTNQGIGLIKIKNIDNSGDIVLKFESYLSNNIFNNISNKFYLNSGDCIIAMTGAELGKVGLIPSISETYLLNQRVGKVISSHKHLFYLFLKSDSLQSLFFGIASASSAQGNISNTDIESVNIIIPQNNDLLNLFEQSISDLYFKYIENLGENIKLAQIRNTLLPKLMSGEIRVDY